MNAASQGTPGATQESRAEDAGEAQEQRDAPENLWKDFCFMSNL